MQQHLCITCVHTNQEFPDYESETRAFLGKPLLSLVHTTTSGWKLQVGLYTFTTVGNQQKLNKHKAWPEGQAIIWLV